MKVIIFQHKNTKEDNMVIERAFGVTITAVAVDNKFSKANFIHFHQNSS
jgi:nitrous oxidase accessory protein NosD